MTKKQIGDCSLSGIWLKEQEVIKEIEKFEKDLEFDSFDEAILDKYKLEQLKQSLQSKDIPDRDSNLKGEKEK